MIKIAIVGKIGSGKSHVANLFGFPVFNADKEVSRIYKKDKLFFNQVSKRIPKFITKFPIDKKEILNCILEKDKNLKIITKIIHPIVRKKMNFFLRRNKKKKAVVLDIPLYLENKINKRGDIIIFIQANQKTINKRLKKRSFYNEKLINKFKKIQLKSNLKKKKSDYIIDNKFNSIIIKKKIKKLKQKIFNPHE